MSKNNLRITLRTMIGQMVLLRLTVLAAMCMPCFGLQAEPVPDLPLVASPQNPCAWIIDVERKKPRQKQSADPAQAANYKRLTDIYPLLVRVTVEKVGKDCHRKKIFDNQKEENVWVYKGVVIFQFKN